MSNLSIRRKILLYKICTFILALSVMVLIIALSNPTRGEEIKAETPMPESRTRIEYRTIEVPYEVQAEPVYIKQYVEVVAHNENRYSDIEITEEDRELMAAIVYHEARGECFAGQRMVVEVILNRVLSDKFPNTIKEVIYQKNPVQFTSALYVSSARPDETQRAAVNAAIAETPITDEDVLFFMQGAYNNKIFCKIGSHIFCRG